MHRYLRAIGFSNVTKREQLQDFIQEVVVNTISKNQKKKKNKEYYASMDFMADDDDQVYA